MSNLVSNPIVVTGSVASYKAAVASSLGSQFTLIVYKIRWVNPGISQTLSIGDPQSGAILELFKSDTAGEDVESEFIPPKSWIDFSVDAFPGGTLLIFTR